MSIRVGTEHGDADLHSGRSGPAEILHGVVVCGKFEKLPTSIDGYVAENDYSFLIPSQTRAQDYIFIGST